MSLDIPSNALIVSANPTNMKKIHELLDTLERTIAIQFEPVTIEVHNAPPSQIVSFIQQFLGDSGGDGQGGGRRGQAGGARRGPNIVPNDNAMTLIVSGSAAEVERIRVLAAKFDDPQIVSSQIKVIPIPRGQDAFTLATTVEQLVNNSEAELAARTGRFAKQIVVGADGYSNAIILGGDATLFGMAVTIIDQLALVRTENIVTRVINLKNLSADDLKTMIDDLQSRRRSSSSGTIRRTGGGGTFNRNTGGTNRRRTTPTGGGTRRRGGRGMLWQPNRLQLDQNMLYQPASYGSPMVTVTVLTPSLLSAVVTGLLGNDGAADQDRTAGAKSNKKSEREFAVVNLIDDMSVRFKKSLGLDRARDWWKRAAGREIERLRIEREMTAAPVAETDKPAVVEAAELEPAAIENEFAEMTEALRTAGNQELSLEMPVDAVVPEIAATPPVAIDAAAAPAQDAGRAVARQPVKQDKPKEQPQGTIDERLLQGVSGELKGDVTATVIDGGTIFITGDEDDIRFIELLAAAMELSAPKPEIAVFTLKTANAAALAPALEQTIQGIMDVRSTTQRPADRFTIIPDSKSNSLIVSASQSNMLLIEDLIAKLDIASDTDFDFKNVPMKNARAVEAAVQITPIIDQLSTVRGLPAEAQPKIQAIDRSNSIMIMGTPPAIEEIERLIEAYDVEITAADAIANAFSTAEMIWIPIKNGNAEDIATALSTMIQEQQEAAVAADPTRPGLPVIRKIRMSTLAGEVLPELDLEKPIRILADKGTNSLIVFSTEKNIESLTAMVSLFDTLPTGVEIEVKSFALKNAESETVAEKLQEIFDDGKKALMRPSASGTTFPDGVMPPVPPSIAAKGLPYEVHVTHDGRSNTVFVIGHKDAVLLAAGLITEMDKPNANLGMRYEVIEVEHQASQLAEKLTDLLDKRQAVLGSSVKNPQRDNALITADDRANLLIVMAPNDVFEMVIDLIERIDGAPNNRIVTTDFRALDFADANKLAAILQELFDAKKAAEGAVTPDVKDELYIIADPRSNSLMLTGTLDYMDEVRDLIDKLDRKFDPTVEFKIRPVRLTSAATLANRLQEMVDRQQENQETATFGTTPIYISSDPFTNNLIVGASKEDMDMLDRWIEVLDKPHEFGRMTRIFPLTSRLDAEETAGKLEPAFSQMSGGGQGGQSSAVTITFDAGTNAIIAIAPPAILDDIEQTIVSMENVDIRAIARTRKFDLKEADAETVAELLQGILEGRSGTIGQTGGAAARADAVREVMLLYERRNPETGVTTVERLMRADVTVLADTRTDSIWITAPVESMPMMESLLAAVDVPPKAAKIRIFPLRNADAEQMVETLQDLFPDSSAQSGAQAGGDGQTQLSVEGLGGGGGKQEVTFTTDMRTNSVIAAGTKGALDIVSEFILELDTRPIRGHTTRVYTPRNNPAESIAASLNEFSDAQLARMDRMEDISDMIRMEQEIIAISNDDSNTLLISYDPRRESEVLDIIRDLDQPPPQVMIEVLIVEVTLDNSLDLGVEFAFQDLQFAKAGPSDTNTFDFVGGTDLGAAGAGLGGFTFTITGADFNFLLRALQSTGSLNVLSRPMIMAMDNQEAVFEVVNDVPYISSTAITAGGVAQNQIARSDVGIKLTVTPQINPDGFVRMQIVQEVSDFGGGTIEVGAGVTSPIFFRRLADTTVTVMDNETVVLGGMIQTRTQSTEQKIPILGDLPLLGPLFRNTLREKRTSELVIFITPHILGSPEPGGGAGDADEVGILSPWVVHHDDIYKMWYTGIDANVTHHICYATSLDGITWQKYNDNPVLPVGDNEEFDSWRIHGAPVLINENGYHMWYGGRSISVGARIGYAHSSDGINWTKLNTIPVLSPDESTWEGNHMGASTVMDMGDGNLKMWYFSGYSPVTSVGYATGTWEIIREHHVLGIRPTHWIAGDSVTVPVVMNRVTAVAGIDFAAVYDTTLLSFVSYDNSDVTSDFIFEVNSSIPGSLAVSMASSTALGDADTLHSVIGEMTFLIAADAQPADTAFIDFTSAALADTAGSPIRVSTIDGYVTVPIDGDVNLDGHITSGDAVIALRSG
ncbi:MAG: hypothetical protein IID33_02530, partial [Planctomycetes bacterium]|nr:hypothetical protein [Planctomycetota bacterium]